MKVAPLGQVKNDLSAYVKLSQTRTVLVTRHGRPAAVIIGVEGKTLEELIQNTDTLARARKKRRKA